MIEEKELNEQIEIVPTDEESFLGKLERLAIQPVKKLVVKSPVGDLIKQFEKRNLNPAIPPSKKNLIKEFRNLGINTKLVTAMKTKFEEKYTSITGNETNDDLPGVMVCDVDEQPGGLMCKIGMNGLGLCTLSWATTIV